jgi:hypothetical protein
MQNHIIVRHPNGGWTFIREGCDWHQREGALKGRTQHPSMKAVADWLRSRSVGWQNIVWPFGQRREE